jgi:DNA-binding NtrC family response regulator
MAQSILNGKRILAVEDEADVLAVLEEEIMSACPDCKLDKSTTYEQSAELLKKNDYDIVVLDIMGVQGFDLLKIAADRKLRAVMLTAKALTPEALKKSHDLGARAFLPKDMLGEVVPFLEDALTLERATGWKRLLHKLEDYFDDRWGEEWKKKYPFSY